jgi:hypothetical protein
VVEQIQVPLQVEFQVDQEVEGQVVVAQVAQEIHLQ